MSDNKLYPWLEPYWLQIQSLQKQSRLPHALMLRSISGLGVEELANTIGSALLCKTPTENGYPCLDCADCNLLKAGTHPDFHFISILEKKSAILVEQIRDLVDVCRERPHQGGYRVAIVDPSEAMNIKATNALLKTLEEPGDDTILILVCNATNSLPATVRSRCHLINIEPPSEADGIEWLLERHVDDKKKTLLALRLSHHAPIQAEQLLTSDILLIRQNFLAGLARATTGKLDPVKLAATINKTDVMSVTDWMYSLVLDAQKQSHQVPDAQLTNNDQSELLNLLKSKNTTKINKWIEQLLEGRRLLATSSNINPQLILEDLIFRWIAIFQ